MRLGIVTCEKCRDLTLAEQELLPLLHKEGIHASPVVWNDPKVDWRSFDRLLVRSIWDYHLYPAAFLLWLDSLANLKLEAWNPVEVLRRNSHKFYLRDLEASGVRIIPTLFQKAGSIAEIKARGWNSVVVKPAVSASAFRTEIITVEKSMEPAFREAASHGDYLVQEFTPAVLEGEFSIIFFNGVYSHAVVKRARKGEFRVQKEFGGEVISHDPNPSIIDATGKVITAFGGETLYARVDGVVDRGEFVLMELELIEPDLFLDYHPDARTKFVSAILKRL